MALGDSTNLGGTRKSFPPTQWTMLEALRGSDTETYCSLVGQICRMYWKPLYCYVRSTGRGREDAKDITQDFLADWIEKKKFLGAERSKGRFRSYLLKALQRHLHNVYRAENAQKRRPIGGVVSLEDVIPDEDFSFEPADEKNATPEEVFHRIWLKDILLQSFDAFQQECQATGKEVHLDVFQRCVFEPLLHQVMRPPRRELAKQWHLTEKEISARLVTARRAFMGVLREEIRSRVFSEQDVACETQDVFHYLSSS